ncbi:MAG: imidazole glycerol phosphate synthase subunit HisH [Bacteroidetes bacterium]|nr:imidazole glycerol phosphate synthase subunit HisH [Bacteroidota bacterium]MBS1973261.1 imidazole glycerol phosphate synthase subunit HisH [Bacteroidota bacterium]
MITIIDYGVGNLASIQNMLKKSGHEAAICNRASEIEKATKIILPGMGHFDNCMQKFNQSGFRPIIEKKALQEQAPVLGICVGLQMFMRSSEEGNEKGLGWIAGETIKFKQDKLLNGEKIPNMGWLDIVPKKGSRLLSNLNNARFYFAHSYHVQADNGADELLVADYGYPFAAALEHENILGVQFHPEKSHRFGMQLLKNFAENY